MTDPIDDDVPEPEYDPENPPWTDEDFARAKRGIAHLPAPMQAALCKMQRDRQAARRYPVTLTPDDNGTFTVTFPDVPGAVTFGETREDALAHAVDALLIIFDAFMADRRDIPAPSLPTADYVELPIDEFENINAYRAARAAQRR